MAIVPCSCTTALVRELEDVPAEVKGTTEDQRENVSFVLTWLV